jgi:hypothetical protein
MRSGAAALLSHGRRGHGDTRLEGPEPLRSWARLPHPFVAGTRSPRSCTRIMPSLPWICERVLRARAITVALAGRWPEPLLDAVVEAYRQGAALVVFTAPGYELAAVHAFLDLGLTLRHSAVETPGLLVLDQREGWLVGSYLPVDHPRLTSRALEHGQVAEWVRFRGRVGDIDPASHAFTIEGFPHVTLYGTLPGECAVVGAFVRVTGLRSLALGQEGYHPHSLHVVEVVPRAQDDLMHRLDLAVRASVHEAGDARVPEFEALLRQRGFSGREDLETYLLDHGVLQRMVTETVAEVAPDAPPTIVNAVMIVIAGLLQAHPAASGPLPACTSILGALIRSASSADVAAALVVATEVLLDRAPRGLWAITARSAQPLLDRLRMLTTDLRVLSGEAVTTAVVAPGRDADPGPMDGPPATIPRVSAALAAVRTGGGTPGVLVAMDAAAWTKGILAARIVQGSPSLVRIGLHTGLRGAVDVCLPRHVRCRVRAGSRPARFCGTLDAIVLLVRALRIAQDARLRELHRPSGPIAPRIGSA